MIEVTAWLPLVCAWQIQNSTWTSWPGTSIGAELEACGTCGTCAPNPHESMNQEIDCPRDSSSDRQTRLMASLLKATLTLMTPALSLYGAESVLLRFLLNCSLTLLSSITLPVFRFMTSRNQLQKLEEGGMRPCVCPWHQPTTQVMGTCGRLYHKVQESQLESCKSKWLWEGNTRQCSETCFSTRTTRSFVKHVSYKLDFV